MLQSTFKEASNRHVGIFSCQRSVWTSSRSSSVHTLHKLTPKHIFFVYVSVFQTRPELCRYREDTPAAVVFQANRQLQSLSQNTNLKSSEWVRYHSIGIFTGNLTPAALLSQDEDAWNEAVRISRTCVKICSNCVFSFQVLKLSQYFLLYTASPAAIVRLLNSDLKDEFGYLCKLYKGQHHTSISDFLDYHIHSNPTFNAPEL